MHIPTKNYYVMFLTLCLKGTGHTNNDNHNHACLNFLQIIAFNIQQLRMSWTQLLSDY